MQEKESIISVRHGWTNLSLGSLFGITRQSLVMPNSDPWDRFVHPYLTLMSDYYIVVKMGTVTQPTQDSKQNWYYTSKIVNKQKFSDKSAELTCNIGFLMSGNIVTQIFNLMWTRYFILPIFYFYKL